MQSDGTRRIAPREIFEDIYVPIGVVDEKWSAPGKRELPLEAAASSPGSRRAMMI